MDQTVVTGVGMIPFAKPGKSENYQQMGEQAARLALLDAGVDYTAIQQAYVGYVYGDSTCGQAALYGLGQTGIPIINVNNNCATGSSALYLARQAVASGLADCVLALGFEQMVPGAIGMAFADRVSPLSRHEEAEHEIQGTDPAAPMAAQLFGGAGQAYTDEYGTDPAVFARISVKARQHAAGNPYAVFTEPLTLEQVLGSPVIYGPLTRFQCCPPTCGAAAAVICSPEDARRHELDGSVAIRAQAMTTETATSFEADMRKVVGYDLTADAASQVYERAGSGPEEIPAVEL